MKIPDAIMVSKKLFKARCPACSTTFDITAYEGSNGHEKIDKMIADYESHFKGIHGKENACGEDLKGPEGSRRPQT